MLIKSSRVILIISAALLWIDVFTYQGYLQSLISIPSKIIIVMVFGLGALLSIINHKNNFNRFHVVNAVVACLLIFYCAIVAIEGSAGQGYIFTHLGMRPESIFMAVLSTIWTLIALTTKTFWSYIFIAIISFYVIRLMPIVVTQSVVTTREIIKAPFASYDKKIGLLWGNFYAHMQEIVRNTPNDAVISIPADVQKYPLDGNIDLVRYFVYPRKVVVEGSL